MAEALDDGVVSSAPQVCRRPTSDAHLCARYEALFDLLARLRSRTSIEALAELVCQQWRFCANVSGWRLLGEVEGGFVLIDGIEDKPKIKLVPSLADYPTEQWLWNNRRPRRLTGDKLNVGMPPLAAHLCGGDVCEVLIRLVDNESRGERFLIQVAAGREGFTGADLRFIDSVASMLVREICYLRAMEKLTQTLQAMALHDPLTDLPNRRYFESQLASSWRNMERGAEPLSMLMIDVDYFKKFNDTFGHIEGDVCLKRVAATIRRAAGRPLDFCARLGGEEFAVLLPNTPIEGAIRVGNRLREELHNEAIAHIVDGRHTFVTVSVGAATALAGCGTAAEALVKAADEAVYKAKQSGRDNCHHTGQHLSPDLMGPA